MGEITCFARQNKLNCRAKQVKLMGKTTCFGDGVFDFFVYICSRMKYVDVVVALPLEGLFTYEVPSAWESLVSFGTRVLVPFGTRSRYVGIVLEVHGRKPEFDCKPIAEVLDAEPSLLPCQYRLWKWIADYYMSPLGEVYRAALPGGMTAVGKYRPKTETYIALCEPYRSERALHVAMGVLRNAAKQLRLFSVFLSLSHWDSVEGDRLRESLVEVTREELLNESGCSTAALKALLDRKLLCAYEKEVGRLNRGGIYHPELIQPLSPPQREAHDSVLRQMEDKNVILLHGVTSSGKTEIYIHLIREAIERGRQVLYLLPEIALTVQIMERLHRVFGDRLGIYHSKYSDEERVEIWRKQLSSCPYDVILGARSAVFLPFQRLGLVIIDEEHETSFKQQDPAPRYHARSVAIMLASFCGAKTLLGTATPSMESYANALSGKYGFVKLTTRYQGVSLPRVEVVDIKDLRRRKLMSGPFSPRLLSAVREALAAGKQAILFQNRRGFAPRIECRECGWVPRCQNCDVSLTYHKLTQTLTCHYCGYTYVVPKSCPCCGSEKLVGRGYGTEKIEDQIRDLLPEAHVARMDLDTTRTRNAYERLIGDFSRGRTNLLVGTQMISKGLDFDNVSVVGILDADTMLNYPDFRAYEHAFMMMSQVSGRAGRKGSQGLVILQTRDPQAPVIRQVVAHDYEGFADQQMRERALFHYPPYYHLVYVFLKHKHDDVVEHAAQDLGRLLRQWFSGRVLGPDKPAVARVKTLHIRKIMLKLENGIDLPRVRECLRLAQRQVSADSRYGGLAVYYDVDPM